MAQIDLETIALARKQLKKKPSRQEVEVCEELKNTPNGARLTCPFCMYESKKNKFSAFIKNDMFKCMACGIAKRVR